MIVLPVLYSWPSLNQRGGVKTVSFLILQRISKGASTGSRLITGAPSCSSLSSGHETQRSGRCARVYARSTYTREDHLAACRREESSSPPSCSPRERVLHDRGRVDLLLVHRGQKRDRDGSRMTWKESIVPVLRTG